MPRISPCATRRSETHCSRSMPAAGFATPPDPPAPPALPQTRRRDLPSTAASPSPPNTTLARDKLPAAVPDAKPRKDERSPSRMLPRALRRSPCRRASASSPLICRSPPFPFGSARTASLRSDRERRPLRKPQAPPTAPASIPARLRPSEISSARPACALVEIRSPANSRDSKPPPPAAAGTHFGAHQWPSSAMNRSFPPK